MKRKVNLDFLLSISPSSFSSLVLYFLYFIFNTLNYYLVVTLCPMLWITFVQFKFVVF